MPQLFDLSGSDDRTLNHHLECLCKALSEPHDPPEGKGDMWEPHPSVFLRQLVEAFTSVGLKMTAEVQAQLWAWLSGQMHAGGDDAHPLHQGQGPHAGGTAGSGGPYGAPPGGGGAGGGAGGSGPFPLVPAVTWSPEAVAAVRAHLLSKAVADWTVEDFLLCVDLVVHTAMPPGWAEAQADWLAARAGLMAKVESSHPDATIVQVGNVLAAMPNSVAAAAVNVVLKPALLAAMVFGRARAGENIKNVNEALRHQIKSVVLQALEQGYQGASGGVKVPMQALQQRLFDAFAEHNRDWRRIAVTEAGEIRNQGFVGLQDPGTYLRRAERYRGACAFCRGLDGRVFKVVDPSESDKDGHKEIWVGKTNVGRSASPNKRVDGALVPREPSELWWAAAGVQHPHCRGSWIQTRPPLPTSSDKAWKEWLAHLGLDAGGS